MGSLYNNAIFVSTVNKIPKVKHWAIFFSETYTTPGRDKDDPTDIVNKIDYQAPDW